MIGSLETINMSLTIALIVGTICFLLYWFVAHSKGYKEHLKRWIPAETVDILFPFFQKGLGVLLIGVVPGIVLWVFSSTFSTDYGMMLDRPQSTILWTIIFGGMLFFIPYFSARKPEMQEYYPQIRKKEWDIQLIVLNTFFWAAYLFAYEFLFRSFFLNTFLISLDTTSAVVLTTIISVSTHMPKGALETFGTIPFSVMLCLAMLVTGSIWAGFVIHLVLALSNDYWALHFNPQMGMKKTLASVNRD